MGRKDDESGPGSPPDSDSDERETPEVRQEDDIILELQRDLLRVKADRDLLKGSWQAAQLKVRRQAEGHASPVLLVDEDPDVLVDLLRKHRHLSALRERLMMQDMVAKAVCDRVRLNEEHNRLNMAEDKALSNTDHRAPMEAFSQERENEAILYQRNSQLQALRKRRADLLYDVIAKKEAYSTKRREYMDWTQQVVADDLLRDLQDVFEQLDACCNLYQALLVASGVDPIANDLPLAVPRPNHT